MNGRTLATLAGSLGLLVVVLVVLLQTRPAPPSELARLLDTVTARVDAPLGAQITEVDLDGPRLRQVVADVGGDRLRVRVTGGLDPETAATRIDEHVAVVFNQFGDRQAPYPGQLSHTLQCPEKFQPVLLPSLGAAVSAVGLYANDRLAYGGCSEDLLRYRATIGFFYEPTSEQMMQVEYFSALDGRPDRGAEVVAAFSIDAGTGP